MSRTQDVAPGAAPDPASALVEEIDEKLRDELGFGDDRPTPIIYERIDPDAFRLLANADAKANVTFELAGCRVRVSDLGANREAEVEVTPLEAVSGESNSDSESKSESRVVSDARP